jgi:hypothetical protein
MTKLQNLFAQKKNSIRQFIKSLGQAKERPNEHIDFNVDLALWDYSTAWSGLCEAMAKQPKTMKIQLTFCVNCSVEWVLMTNLLLAENPKVVTHVHTYCNLNDAALLLLLSGNRKSASWWATTRLTKLEELRAFENQDDEEEQDLFAEPRHVAFASNYASALKVIDSYLPVRALGSRRHNICHLLQEYGLLSEPPVLPYTPNRVSFGL